MLKLIPYYLILASLFVPRITVGGTWVGLDDFLLLTVGVAMVVLRFQRVSSLCAPIFPMLMFVAIYIPLGLIQSYSYIYEIKLPTEIWQHVKRIIVFLMFAYAARFEDVDVVKKLSLCFVLVLIGYQAVGVIQVLGGGVGEHFSSIYARTDGQYEKSLNIYGKRIFGVAGHSISWGGFSGFSLFALCGLLTLAIPNIYMRNKVLVKVLMLLFVFLCLFNVYYSGSRAAIIATVLAICAAFFFVSKDRLFVAVKNFPLVAAVLGGAIYFAYQNIEALEFVIYRFSALMETRGGGRDEQVFLALGLINSPHEWLFGVSNPVQRALGISHGIEVEFVNVLVNYGVLGVVLLYAPLLVLYLRFKLKGKEFYSQYFNLCVSGKSVIILYLVFSAGYFFFAELIVGTLTWAFLGLAFGAIRRVNILRDQAKDAGELRQRHDHPYLQ